MVNLLLIIMLHIEVEFCPGLSQVNKVSKDAFQHHGIV